MKKQQLSNAVELVSAAADGKPLKVEIMDCL